MTPAIRSCRVLMFGKEAGILRETESGYVFAYGDAYLRDADARAVSVRLPLRPEPFVCATLHPFFDGLIPEGWMLDIAVRNWKLDRRDRMGLLMNCCRNCIGAVSIVPAEAQP